MQLTPVVSLTLILAASPHMFTLILQAKELKAGLFLPTKNHFPALLEDN